MDHQSDAPVETAADDVADGAAGAAGIDTDLGPGGQIDTSSGMGAGTGGSTAMGSDEMGAPGTSDEA